MGIDFLRRRNDRFLRQRDARFVELIKPDLFSACVPSTVVNVCGTALCDLDSHQELWAPVVAATGPIDFYRGDVAAVRLHGGPADHVRSQRGTRDAPVVARIVHVEREHGLVLLRVGSGP